MNKGVKGCLIGCGAVLVIALLLLGFGIFRIYRSTQQYAADIDKVMAAYEQTNEDFPFTVPEEGQMEPERFETFVDIRSQLIDVGYQQIGFPVSEIGDATGTEQPSFGDILSSFKSIMRLPVKLGKAHENLLQEQGMSLDEYYWYDQAFIATMRQAAASGDPFYKEVIGNFEDDQTDEIYGKGEFDWRSATGEGWFPNAEQNLPVLEAHRAEINDTSPDLWVDITFMSFAHGIKQNKKVEQEPLAQE